MGDLLNNFYVTIERRNQEEREREENTQSIIKQIANEFRRERKNRKQNKPE